MPNVYITQDNKKNYSQAHSYGKPVFVTNLEYSSIGNSDANETIHKQIHEIANVYKPNEDYLLLSGDPIVISLVIFELLTVHGSISVLKWQSRDRVYTPIRLVDTVNIP